MQVCCHLRVHLLRMLSICGWLRSPCLLGHCHACVALCALQVLLDAQVLALACMTELLSGDQRRRYTDLIDSPFMPALRAPVPLSHIDRPKKLPTAPQVCSWSSDHSCKTSSVRHGCFLLHLLCVVPAPVPALSCCQHCPPCASLQLVGCLVAIC
jgi:hypothetical protein